MVERRQVKRYLAYLASLTAAGAGLTPVVGMLAGSPSAAAGHGTSVRPAVAPAAQLALSNAVPQAAPNVAATCEWGDQVGVSIDLFGGMRVNIAGRDLQERVLENMQRLRREGIAFGCITVLHRGNIDKVERIWRFYEGAGIAFRTLPLFEGASADQNTSFSLSLPEINTALCRLVDLWLASDNPVQVLPLSGQIRALMRHLSPYPQARFYYNKREWCWVLLVNTNGNCFSNGDPYGHPDWVLGNIFTTPLAEIFGGEAFERSVRETEKRIAANCLQCPFFGGCDGRHIGDHLDNVYQYQDGIAVCGIDRTVITHLERRLRESDLIDGDGRFTPATEVAAATEPAFAG